MKTIVIYNDSSQIGGHEILGVRMAKELAKSFRIFFIYNAHNKALSEKLSEFELINSIPLDYHSTRSQILRNFISFRTIAKINKHFKSIKPDACILLQGNIDTSFLAAFSCLKYKIKIISYIPIAQHLEKVSRNKYIGVVKDYIQQFYYNIPDIFITITNTQKREIECRNSKVPIYIVNNGVEFDKLLHFSKNKARIDLNLPIDSYIICYIGRLEAWHKGLDYYLNFLEQRARRFTNAYFLFVGTGPLYGRVSKIVSDFDNMRIIDWTTNLSKIYSAIDCLIMPSRFEGLPLTLLEASIYKIPIIASRIPEFEEFIPSDYLFKINDFEELSIVVARAISGKVQPIEINVKNMDSFAKEFGQIVSKIV